MSLSTRLRISVFTVSLLGFAACSGDDGAGDGNGSGGAGGVPDTGGAPAGGTTAGGSGGMPDTGGSGAGMGGQAGMPVNEVTYVVYAGGTNLVIQGWLYDMQAGTLSDGPGAFVSEVGKPSYLAATPDGKNLYASDEGDVGRLGAMAIEAGTGKLTALNKLVSGGKFAVHTTVHPTGNWVLVSTYNDPGNIRVFPIGADGKLGEPAATENTGTNSHQVKLTPDGKYVFVPCRGPDYTAQFAFDAETGMLTASDPATVASDDPRHIAFTSDSNYGYLLNETPAQRDQGAPANVVVYSQADGKLTEIEKQDLDADERWGGHIEVTPDDKFVYASGRSTETIFIFERNPADGKLTPRESFDGESLIDRPRDFTIDPAGNHLIVASKDLNQLVVLKINKETGALTKVGDPVSAPDGTSTVVVVPVPMR